MYHVKKVMKLKGKYLSSFIPDPFPKGKEVLVVCMHDYFQKKMLFV